MKYAHYKCGKCEGRWRVADGDRHRSLLAKAMICPQIGCGGQVRLAPNSPSTTRLVKATDLFRASNGLGWPEERKCSVKDLKRFLGAHITGLEIEDTLDNRSIIKSIKIEIGPGKQKLLHFGSGPPGVVIYKVTEVPHAG